MTIKGDDKGGAVGAVQVQAVRLPRKNGDPGGSRGLGLAPGRDQEIATEIETGNEK